MEVRDQLLVAVALLPGKLSASSTGKEVVRAPQKVRMLGELTSLLPMLVAWPSSPYSKQYAEYASNLHQILP